MLDELHEQGFRLLDADLAGQDPRNPGLAHVRSTLLNQSRLGATQQQPQQQRLPVHGQRSQQHQQQLQHQSTHPRTSPSGQLPSKAARSVTGGLLAAALNAAASLGAVGAAGRTQQPAAHAPANGKRVFHLGPNGTQITGEYDQGKVKGDAP